MWDPTVSIDVISDPDNYEYTGASLRGYTSTSSKELVVLCVGQPTAEHPTGTDTIQTIDTAGGSRTTWSLPGKLVCDPTIWLGGQTTSKAHYLVAATIGEPDGTRNGVICRWGNRAKVHAGDPTAWGPIHTLIPQTTTPGYYGRGQLAIASKPGQPTICLNTIVDANGQRIEARHLTIPPMPTSTGYPAAPTVGATIPIIGGNDGASVDAWWSLSQANVLHVVQATTQMIGLRTYHLVGGQLVRQTQLEQTHTVAGETLSARSIITLGDNIDGAGIVRTLTNQPVIVAGAVLLWRGQGTPTNLGSWQLRKTALPVPFAA